MELSELRRYCSERGARVRMRFDPSRHGECTGEVDEDDTGLLVEVMFPGGHAEWVDATELDPLLRTKPLDHYSRIKEGRCERIGDFRRQYARIQLGGDLTDMFYSMDATHTEFMPHQFKPVLSMLDSPSRGLLIADEVVWVRRLRRV